MTGRVAPPLVMPGTCAMFALMRALLMSVIVAAEPVAPAFAYGIDMSLPMMNSAFAVNAYALQTQLDDIDRRVITESRGNAGATRSTASTSLRVGRIDPAGSAVPARLAAQYPAARRPEAEKTFRQLLAGHAALMARLGLPADDMAGALASFVAGAVMAHNDTDIADAHVPALVAQMRQVLATNAAFAAATPAERQTSFAELAILGTMAATTRLALAADPANPAAAAVRANLKAASASYIAAFTAADPAKVRVTAAGLTIGR